MITKKSNMMSSSHLLAIHWRWPENGRKHSNLLLKIRTKYIDSWTSHSFHWTREITNIFILYFMVIIGRHKHIFYINESKCKKEIYILWKQVIRLWFALGPLLIWFSIEQNEQYSTSVSLCAYIIKSISIYLFNIVFISI